ncbi:MAG: type II secretion system protein [Thermoleophilaceae bacterium]|nr:type II secretion system protein [Thermoleophilaceae bacterium]
MGKKRLKDESGMTLVELLTAELIGGVVISAAIMLVVISFNGSQRVSDRVNALSQGRILSAQIDQRLGSQVCLYSGEYAVNGTTVYTGAADSFVFAGPDKVIFFADVNRGATSSTSSVGFIPYLRFLYFNDGSTSATSRLGAYRSGYFVDGHRLPTNTSVPFRYDLSPLTGANALDVMGTTAGAAQVNPTVSRRIVEGVTSEITGTTALSRVPFFQYYDSSDVAITGVSGVVPTAQLGNIGRIRVNFKILAESKNDSGKQNTSTNDVRTASFSSDTYLRTNPSICG